MQRHAPAPRDENAQPEAATSLPPPLPAAVLDATALDRLYPCHLYVDEAFRIVGCGRVIARLLPGLAVRPRLDVAFELQRPNGVADFTSLLSARNQVFLLRSRDRGQLKLKGELLPLPDTGHAVLLTVPWLSDPQLVDALGLTVSDFALGDATPDMIFLAETQAELLNEAKQMTARLRHARDHALTASRAKSEFLANMSHELRTPLNAIIGFADYIALMGERAKPEQVREYVRDIHGSGVYLLSIVDDLLDLARIEADKVVLEEARFDLVELTHEAMRQLKPQADKTTVTIAMAQAPEGLLVRADPRLVQQILVNLLSDAVKFNREGGRVDVTITMQGGAVEVAITDTGPGVDPAVIAELFEPFRQAVSTVARRYGGTGLGLAIVHRLARLHGGEVAMQSALGEGTTVRLTLPPERVVAA